MKRLFVPLVALIIALAPAPAAAEGGGPSNIVIAINQADGHVVVRGNEKVNRLPGNVAAPVNFAMAQANTCIGCQTLAVALQLDFASHDARYIAPHNAAVAVNSACDGCVTVAKAVQVFFTVEDPAHIPSEISDMIRDVDRELSDISTDRAVTITQAEARVDAIIARFLALAAAYDQQRQAATQ
jgi:hypothetical protein